MSEDRKNLKGTTDKLKYFRRVETGGVDPRLRLLSQEDGSIQSKVIMYKQQEKVFFSEEDVRGFSLDQFGSSIPYIDGELTILNNYLFDFWGYFLGAEGVALYGHLRRYCYGSKDWCYPKIDKIALKMGKTRPTVLNFIEVLEHYGFIYKINVLNEDKDNFEDGAIYKIRKTVPLLTNKLINGNQEITIPEDTPPHIAKVMKKELAGLPEALKKDHEKYVADKFNPVASFNLEDHINFEKIFSSWLANGEKQKITKRRAKYVEKAVHKKLTSEMSEEEAVTLQRLLEKAQEKISKPSYDTWFKNVLLKIDNNMYTLFVPNDFAKDWIEEKYFPLITEWLNELELTIDSLQIDTLAY